MRRAWGFLLGFVIACGAPEAGVQAPAAGAASAPECKMGSSGQQTCGYNCKLGSDGSWYCASTPAGHCALSSSGSWSCP